MAEQRQQIEAFQQVQSTLESLPINQKDKAVAFDSYFDAKDAQDFTARFEKLNLPQKTKAQLWELKFGKEMAGLKETASKAPAKITPPQVGEAAVQHLPEIAAGASIPLTGGMITPAAVGFVGLMGAGGEAAKQLIERGRGRPSPQTSTEAATEIAKQAGIQGGSELGLRAAGGLAKAALGGPLRSATRTAENLPIKETSEKFGLGLTPGELAGPGKSGAAFRVAQRLGESGVWGRPIAEAAQEKSMQRSAQAVESILSSLGPQSTPQLVGQAAQDSIRLSGEVFQRQGAALYKNVDNILNGVGMNMDETAIEAQKILAEYSVGGKYFKASTKIPNAVKPYLEDFTSTSTTNVPFEVLHQKRSEMLSLLRDIRGNRVQTESASESERLLTRLVKTMTDNMEDQAGQMGISTTQEWKNAREFYRRGKELLDDKSVISILKQKDPEKLVPQIGKGSVSLVQRLRQTMLEYPTKFGTPAEKQAAEEAWDNLRGQVVRSNVLKSPTKTEFDFKDLIGMKSRIQDMGTDVMRELFSDAKGQIVHQNLVKLADTMARVQNLPGMSGIGTWTLLRMIASGAIGGTEGALTGGVGGSVVGALAAPLIEESIPMVFAKMIHSPLATDYFVNGISALARKQLRGLRKPIEIGLEAVTPKMPAGASLIARAFQLAKEIPNDARKVANSEPPSTAGPDSHSAIEQQLIHLVPE
jgi:hypothetical protein